MVQVFIKFNCSYLIYGKWVLILFCLGCMDIDWQEFGLQFVSVENFMGVVYSLEGVFELLFDIFMSEFVIVVGVVWVILGEWSKVNWV